MPPDNRPLRILYLIDTLAVGGAERSLAATLPLLSHTHSTVCHLFPGDHLRPQFEDAGIRVISLNLPGDYPLIPAWRAIRRLVADTQPDLIHSMLFRSNIIARLTTQSHWRAGPQQPRQRLLRCRALHAPHLHHAAPNTAPCSSWIA